MKIQAITNTNFKGLFTDKTGEQGGNWRMEYRPYSWEKNNTSKMDAKQTLDIYSSILPDNEEIFTKMSNGNEYSRDVLDTVSYYKQTYPYDSMRKTITEMPAMNREESLRVFDKKLGKFIELKNMQETTLENSMEDAFKKINSNSMSFDRYASDCVAGLWGGADHSRKESAQFMMLDKKCIMSNIESIKNNIQNYTKLRDSIDEVKAKKQAGLEEIKKLEEARLADKLIDISRRDIYDPNRALWEALQNIKTAAQKYIALPHKTVSAEEILKSIGQKVKSADIPAEAIKYVDGLIKKAI